MGAPPPIEFASLGMADSLILMVLALVVFGPRRLPQIGRQIGKLMYEFRKASNDFKFQMEEELRTAEEADRRKREEEERLRNMALSAPTQTATQPPAQFPAQTIEAQAGIGAVESPTASPYPGEGTYPPQHPPETPAEDPEHVVTIPRIQPPTVGEQVSASRPGSSAPADPPAASAITEDDTVDPPVPSAGPHAESVAHPTPAVESSTSQTEPVNQHG